MLMPYEITLADFETRDDSAAWVIGRVIEHGVTGLLAEVGAINESGWWVYRLTKKGHRAQKVSTDGVPKAFILYPVIACCEWHLLERRRGLEEPPTMRETS